jgi:hypothetical protein
MIDTQTILIMLGFPALLGVLLLMIYIVLPKETGEKNMSENKTTEQQPLQPDKPIDWKGNTILGLRFIQMIAFALVAVGFIWGTGDFINSLLPKGTSAPMSVLLILYGLVGSAMVEVPIRMLQRKK